ncbi:MAG: molybdopterin-dependent oxidoreductase [Acidobacteriota bacterium]
MSEREKVILQGDAETVKRESARRTRRSFLTGGVAAAAGYGVWRWVNNSPMVDRLQGSLRKTLGMDAAVDRAVFGFRGLAPTYAMSEAKPLRLNGVIGLMRELEPDGWRLQLAGVDQAEKYAQYAKDVTAWEYGYKAATGSSPFDAPPDLKAAPKGNDGLAKAGGDLKAAPTVGGRPHVDLAARFDAMAAEETGKRHQGSAEAGASASALNIGTPGLLLTMEDLKKLPKVEFVTEFKCIEGWSEKTHWGGVRLRDLIEAYPPAKVNGHAPRYVYMETPDGDFYCGYDMEAAMHPQSLLVMESFGQPLGPEHGAPLRLHMPIKYGYKQLKRIGVIAYMDTKPEDYWEKLGYDWYAGI